MIESNDNKGKANNKPVINCDEILPVYYLLNLYYHCDEILPGIRYKSGFNSPTTFKSKIFSRYK